MQFIDKVFLYILDNRYKGKRTCFDILYLKEWLQWAINKNYLFTETDDKNNITGVVLIFPIGKWYKTPNVDEIIDNLKKEYKDDTDYYIMDAHTKNSTSRKSIVNKILKHFKNIENNNNSEVYAFIKDSVKKFNKKTLLTLKN